MKKIILLFTILASMFLISCGDGDTGGTISPKTCSPACEDYQVCSFEGKCVINVGKCETNADCANATPVCNETTHICEKEELNFECYDLDGDGFGTFCDKGDDCNDNDPLVHPDAEELCGDDQDNNCNRVIDEFCSCMNGEIQDCYTGTDATNNVGECKQGYKTCVEGKFSTCDYEVLPTTEVFDGLDNNCDGVIDDGFELNACGELGDAPIEACDNGLDDNCNGIIDENCGACTNGETRNCYTGIPKELGVGECKAGAQSCEDGVWTECINEVKPSDETCDDKDNNCNGMVDENVLNACGTCGDLPEETCDGVDNNCNGEVDEGVSNACGECGVDTAVPEEVCGNGRDDNCDGIIDEACTCSGEQACYNGTENTLNKGVCKAGNQLCIGGEYYDSNCGGQVVPSIELCDGLDNDCDDVTDEGFNLGGVCFVGLGACKTEGTMVCSDDKRGSYCKANTDLPAPTEEICDGIDNNCNGSVDENYALVNEECSKGIGACQGTGIYVCNDAKDGLTCTAEEDLTQADDELCDEVDNNCNGFIDEGFEFVGTTCTGGKGVCATDGTYQCSADGQEIVCDAEGDTSLQTDEICGDGLDNDCDGFVDDGFEKLNTECEEGKGNCAVLGNFECSSDGLSLNCDATEDLSLARTELCGDSLDNDCDGLIDEGFGLLGFVCNSGLGVCREAGNYVCSDDKLSVVCDAEENGIANQELCGDEVDNNCNGIIDEGFEDLGSPCTVGYGPCEKTGVYVCSGDDKSLECSVTPDMAQASDELCGDGDDNDCDGLIDEGFNVGIDCSDGLGLCKVDGGVYICDTNDLRKTICSVTADTSKAGDELCGDGLDNDCDGLTDEGFNVGIECSDGFALCEVAGVYICDTNNLTKTICNASADMGKSKTELCGDAVDNDCDGYIDEGFEMLNVECSSGIGECKTLGVYECSADDLSLECNAVSGTPTEELCGNNADDNCNGLVDEGFELKGSECSEGKGICQGTGFYVCSANDLSLTCDTSGNPPNPGAALDDELCGDSLDNDCDGFTDEGFSIGADCNNALKGECFNTGVFICSSEGKEECNAGIIESVNELCDGLDNDCDGLTDETFTDLYDVCDKGVGVCKSQGVKICDPDDNTSLICSAQEVSGSSEVCNDGVDNDCDGLTDYDDTADCPLPSFEGCNSLVIDPIPAVIMTEVTLTNTIEGIPDSMLWDVISEPNGSGILLRNPTSAATSFLPLIAGDYKIKFTVTINGVPESCTYDLTIQPADSLNVSILWEEPADFDLHLLKPGNLSDWSTGDDCHYDNCKICTVQIPGEACVANHQIEWSTTSAENAKLDIDNRIGCTYLADGVTIDTCYPENISIDTPYNVGANDPAEHYTVALYYYSGKPNGREGESGVSQDVTITIFCRDDVQEDIQEHKYECLNMDVGEWCMVKDILWKNSTCTVGTPTRTISGSVTATDL